MASTFFPFPTYLGSFLQKSDNNRSVPAPHCPVQRAHSAVVNVLNHGPVIHQELDLGHGRSSAVNAGVTAHTAPLRALAAACPSFSYWFEPGWTVMVFQARPMLLVFNGVCNVPALEQVQI